MVAHQTRALGPQRLPCWIGRATGAAGLVVGSRLILGVWFAAVVLSALGIGRLLVLWASVEARAFDRERPPVTARRGNGSDSEHLAFARALAVVAEAYLAECEREAQL